MNLGERFKIRVNNYDLSVEIIKFSGQIEHYQVELMGRFFILERRIAHKPPLWKLKQTGEGVNEKKLMLSMPTITKMIEAYLKGSSESHARYLRAGNNK